MSFKYHPHRRLKVCLNSLDTAIMLIERGILEHYALSDFVTRETHYAVKYALSKHISDILELVGMDWEDRIYQYRDLQAAIARNFLRAVYYNPTERCVGYSLDCFCNASKLQKHALELRNEISGSLKIPSNTQKEDRIECTASSITSAVNTS